MIIIDQGQKRLLYNYLQKIDLSKSEIQVYIAAVALGKSASSGELAKAAEQKTSTTYLAIQKLLDKGLLNFQLINSKTYYQARDPKVILTRLEIKLMEMEQLSKKGGKAIKLLERIKSSGSSVESHIKIYKGLDAVKTAFMDVLDTDQGMIGYFTISDRPLDNDEKFWAAFFEKFKKIKNKSRFIISDTEKGRQFKERDQNENRQTKLVDTEGLDIIEKNISGDTVTTFFFDGVQPMAIPKELESSLCPSHGA